MTALDRLANYIHKCHRDDEIMADVLDDVAAEQAELVAALGDVTDSLDCLWRSEVRGRNDLPHCPYTSYTQAVALLSRFPSEPA